MSTRSVVIYGGELYHHGILGQKWGVRNGPPYPIDSDDHSRREKKAGWKKSLNKQSGISSRIAKKIVAKQTKDTTYEPKKRTLKDKWNSLSDEQKRAIKIGAAVAVSALAAYGIYRVVKANNGDIRFIDPGANARDALTDLTIEQARGRSVVARLISKDTLKLALENADNMSYTAKQEIHSLKELQKWPPGENTVDNCVDVINRQLSGVLDGRDFQTLSYSEQIDLLKSVPPARTQNCMFCTTAYELNRRGFKCQANDRLVGGTTQQIADIFKITDKKAIMSYSYDRAADKVSRAKSIVKAYTDNYPNGARGNMLVAWKSGGGHSMAWEIIDNKFTIVDAQSGLKYDSPSKIVELLSRTTGDITSVRTDNAELKENAYALLAAVMPAAIRL